MALQEYPTLQDIEPSWADVRANFPIYGGQTIITPDIAAIKWSDKVDVGLARGTSGGRKMKRTTGQYDCDATLTFYRSGWRLFRLALAEKDKRISLVGFDILIQHTPPGTTEIFNVKIVGCRVTGRSADMAEGSDPEKIEIPVNPMLIEEDGITLL
jgi:hypothetical protein